MTDKQKTIILLIVMIALSACRTSGAQSSDVEQVQLINPLGPVVIPLAGITSGEIETDITINVQYWKSIDEAIGLLADEQTQFAVLPITAGANLAASGLDLVLAGVHEWKVILVTEYLCGGSGLGVDIFMARMNIDFASIWGMTLLAVLLGMLMERFTKWAIRKAVVTNP